MILSASDISIALTLACNSLALLSGDSVKRGGEEGQDQEQEQEQGEGKAEFDSLLPLSSTDLLTTDNKSALVRRFQQLSGSVRKYSCFLVLYNFFFFFLIIFVFRE